MNAVAVKMIWVLSGGTHEIQSNFEQNLLLFTFLPFILCFIFFYLSCISFIFNLLCLTLFTLLLLFFLIFSCLNLRLLYSFSFLLFTCLSVRLFISFRLRFLWSFYVSLCLLSWWFLASFCSRFLLCFCFCLLFGFFFSCLFFFSSKIFYLLFSVWSLLLCFYNK